MLLAVGAERHFYAYIDVQVLTPDIIAATALKENHSNNTVTVWGDFFAVVLFVPDGCFNAFCTLPTSFNITQDIFVG